MIQLKEVHVMLWNDNGKKKWGNNVGNGTLTCSCQSINISNLIKLTEY